jgi:hypothetical protein
VNAALVAHVLNTYGVQLEPTDERFSSVGR